MSASEKTWSPIQTVQVQKYSPQPRSDGKRILHDKIPHLLHIETTYRCNYFPGCRFCYNPVRGKLGDMTTIDRIVEVVAESQIPHVYLIGGEPSLLGVERLNRYIKRLSDHSSVTIVTNGFIRLEGISPRLACFGVPIHGANAETHEFHNRREGSFAKTLATIKYYVSQGFDARCIPVLTGYNFNQIYDICSLASRLGMCEVYVDRFEDGGIGAGNSQQDPGLRPTIEQFGEALGQMIRAREDFPPLNGNIGFGTAIPACLDERLISEQMFADCGVGKSFCAVNPDGGFRLCNQSQLVFGNVLTEPIEVIWNNPTLDMFRDLSWVEEPCASCDLLLECTGGCKVDANCADGFCVDYAVRCGGFPKPEKGLKIPRRKLAITYPHEHRTFAPNRYMKVTTKYHPDNFLVTRYQTVKLDALALKMAKAIFAGGVRDERVLIERFRREVDVPEIRRFVSRLHQVEAIDLQKGGA